MSKIGIIRGLRSHSWQGAVRPLEQNSFATLILARWALPAVKRRRRSRRDFKTSHHSAWPGSSLSVQTNPVSILYYTWNFAFYFASSPFSNMFALSRHMHQSRLWQSRQSNTFLLHQEEVSLKSLAPFRLHAAHLDLRTSIHIDPAGTLTQSVTSSTVSLQSLLQRLDQRTNRPVQHRAQANNKFDFATRPLSHVLHFPAALASRSDGREWITHRISFLSTNAVSCYPQPFRTAASTSRCANIVFRSQSSSSVLHAKGIQRLIVHQDRMIALHSGGRSSEELRHHSHLTLQLRTEVERTVSRPAMQFVQSAKSSQPELLSTVQRMETAVAKFQTLQVPAATNAPDIPRLTAQVYEQFERQLRIERERRGR
jgi:hypothetical protein